MDISKVVGVDVQRRHKRRKGRGTGSGAGCTSEITLEALTRSS